MLKGLNYVLSVIALTLAIFLMFMKGNIAMSKGNVMLEVYSRYNFDVLQINIKSEGIIENVDYTPNNVLDTMNEVLDVLEIEKIKMEDLNKYLLENKSYKYVKDAQNAKVEIQISNKDNSNLILEINIIIYDNEKSILYLQNKMTEIYQNLNSKNKTNITIIGTYNHEIANKEKEDIINKIISCLKGKVIQEYENERLYSIYGYTNLIDDYELMENKKTNIHIAMRYNDYEDKTYLYIASPFITNEE